MHYGPFHQFWGFQKVCGSLPPKSALETYSPMSKKGAVVIDENDSGVWNIATQNGSEPESESQAQISSFFKLDAGRI